MSFFNHVKAIIPRYHCRRDEEGFINLGLTWINEDGLEDRNWATIKLHRNSESLALQLGKEQPDGSFAYVDKGGNTHRVSADKVQRAIEQRKRAQEELDSLLSRLTDPNTTVDVIGVTA